LEKQQKALSKQKRLSTAMTTYSNSSYNDETNTNHMQEFETSPKDVQKQQKALGRMSTTTKANNNNEKATKKNQKSHSIISVCKTLCS